MTRDEEFALLMMIGVMQYTLESMADTIAKSHHRKTISAPVQETLVS